jgi:hypothetical protein
VSTPAWLVTVSDYLGVILVLAAVIGLMNRWFVRQVETVHQVRMQTIIDRLSSLEYQFKVNGGLSMRDAVNRIENRQRAQAFRINELSRALRAADLSAPVASDDDEAAGDA